MNKGHYLCKVPDHSHNSRSERDKCVKASKIQIMNRKNALKKLQNKLKCQKMDSKEDQQIQSDCTLYQDSETIYFKSWPDVILNLNETLLEIDYIASKRAADRFLSKLKFNQIDQDYLKSTDQDKQFRFNEYKNWRRSLTDNQQIEKKNKIQLKENIEKFQTKQIQRRIKRTNKNRKTKMEIGKMFEFYLYAGLYYDQEYLLNLLPTQIPKINERYRQRQKKKYESLEITIQSIYLQVEQSQDAKYIRKRIYALNNDVGVLSSILEHNIFNKREIWHFHYEQFKTRVQQQIVNIWIILKSLPKTNTIYYFDEDIKYFSSWMGYALPKYNQEYCRKFGLIKDPQNQFILDAQDEDLEKIDLSKVEFSEPLTKIEKYYKSWDELASQLGKNYRKQQNKLEFQTNLSYKSSQMKPDDQTPFTKKSKSYTTAYKFNPNFKCTFTETYRLYLKEKQLKRKDEYCNKKIFEYSRIYFKKSDKIYWFTQKPKIRSQQKTYQLFSNLDPVCPECEKAMKLDNSSQFINFLCVCGHVWKKPFKKQHRSKKLKVNILVSGIQKKQKYESIKNRINKRNNFHQFSYHWMRRAQYSEQIPLKLRTSIPQFSSQTNLQIEYNREEENYLPLQICESFIPNAGKGIRVTQIVKKGDLILTYTGVIKPHYEVKSNNNSLFSLGIINTDDEVAILIDPVEKGNAAKYINTSYKKFVNCRAELGIFLPRTPDLPEPAVILIAIKDIYPGNELLYEYGKLYGDFALKKKQKK